jgi:hypothetical protein
MLDPPAALPLFTSPPPQACVEIVLDGPRLTTSMGELLAILTGEGWQTPSGLATERLRVALAPPEALVDPAALAEAHQREDAAWLEEALKLLRELAAKNSTLTVDDIFTRIARPPRDPRAQMSALMRAGETECLIERTEHTRPSARIRRPVRVWRSLIFPTAS